MILLIARLCWFVYHLLSWLWLGSHKSRKVVAVLPQNQVPDVVTLLSPLLRQKQLIYESQVTSYIFIITSGRAQIENIKYLIDLHTKIFRPYVRSSAKKERNNNSGNGSCMKIQNKSINIWNMYYDNNKGIGDAGSTADLRMPWSAIVCLGLL